MLNLSRSEAHILFVLAGARGKVVSAEMVGERFSGSGTPQNTVRVLITRIRKKLGEACPIETVHGRGYRWNADETRRARPSLQPRRSRTAAGH